MSKNNKIRATYETLFQTLVSTNKGSQKINNFIAGFKQSIKNSMLPLKMSEARVSLTATGKASPKKKASKTTSTVGKKESPRKRASKKK